MNEIATMDDNTDSLVQTTALAAILTKAELDQQVSTAKAFPRVLSKVISNIQTLATLDEESAKECIYALPRGGKPIRGASIRMAEIIVSQWGNCRAEARVVHVDRVEKYVEAEGIFHDLETNSAQKARVRRKISDKYGKIYNDDMINVTGNAACSIAKRNVILASVPKAVWRKPYEMVEKAISGDIKTLTERRALAIKSFANFGVTEIEVLASLELTNISDVTLDHMPILQGMHSALKNGEATKEEMFGKSSSKPEATNIQARVNSRSEPHKIEQ